MSNQINADSFILFVFTMFVLNLLYIKVKKFISKKTIITIALLLLFSYLFYRELQTQKTLLIQLEERTQEQQNKIAKRELTILAQEKVIMEQREKIQKELEIMRQEKQEIQQEFKKMRQEKLYIGQEKLEIQQEIIKVRQEKQEFLDMINEEKRSEEKRSKEKLSEKKLHNDIMPKWYYNIFGYYTLISTRSRK